MSETSQLEDEEIDVLVEDLIVLYGYDFSDYAKASLKRRINRLFSLDRFPSFAEFRYRIRSDPDYMKRFIEQITVNVTEMFRDPGFYANLREKILPVLTTYPFIRIWHAGCSTGEEVYSMAIMLQEAGLLQKSILYATDINQAVLEKARTGIFSAGNMQLYSENYIRAGGLAEFSAYYTANYNSAKFDPVLSEKMIFSSHNLVSDASFNEFQLIVCRNTLIYFDKLLQEKVFRLFDQSLERKGFLCLGSRESLQFSHIAAAYTQLPGKEKIWQKTG